MNSDQPPENDIRAPASTAPPSVSPQVQPAPASRPATVEQLSNVEERMSVFERSTLHLGRYGLGITVLTGLFIALQWYEMHGSSHDTHDLGVAAKAQADAVKSQYELIRQEVEALRQTANSSAISAVAAQHQVSAITHQMRQDQRAWINVSTEMPSSITENGTVEGAIRLNNVGKTVAKKVSVRAVVEIVHNKDNPKLGYKHVLMAISTQGYMLPQAAQPVAVPLGNVPPADVKDFKVMTHQEMLDLAAGKMFFVIYSFVSYRDIFGVHHWIKTCAWKDYATSPGTFTARRCTDYNDVDSN